MNKQIKSIVDTHQIVALCQQLFLLEVKVDYMCSLKHNGAGAQLLMEAIC